MNAKIWASVNLRAILKNSAFIQLSIGLAPWKPVNVKLGAVIKLAKVVLRVKRSLVSYIISFLITLLP